jgi:hypothetical protein
MVALILVALIVQMSSSPLNASATTLMNPLTVTELDTNKLKGDPVRLSWSLDGSEFYVQSTERDRKGAVKSTKHYIVSAASGTVKEVDAEPAWSKKYWAWKSGQASPGTGTLKISVESRQETVRSTAAPVGGALARGGGADPNVGTTLEDVASAVDQSQKKNVFTLKLKNQPLGEWINEAVVPGVNFGWAPAPMNAMVFAKREGGPLTIVDESGRKEELTGAKTAILPAWSDDGKRIAWLERTDRKKFELRTAEISAK